MFKYAKSAFGESFDFIKRLIYAFQIVVQIVYIANMAYRLTSNLGNFIGNILLLSISVIYVLFQIITTKEFHTKEQIAMKESVKWKVKISKYMVNSYIIVISILDLVGNKVGNPNASMLMTILMILGFVLSVVFDIVVVLIDRQIELIENAVKYDIEMFKIDQELQVYLLKNVLKFDLEKMFPKFENKKAIKKVQNINHKQEQKQMRKRDFNKKMKK